MLHPKDNISLRYHFDVFITDWVHKACEEFMSHQGVVQLGRKFPARNIQKFLEQNLYIEALSTVRELYRRQIASEYFGVEQSGFVECPYDLLPVIKKHWKIIGNYKIRATYIRPILRKFANKYRSGKKVFSTALNKMMHKRMTSIRASIAVELVEGANPKTKSDVYWLSSGLIEPEEVLLIFESGNSFFWDIDKQISEAHKSGIYNLITLDPSLQRKGAIRYWYPSKLPGWVSQYRKLLSGMNWRRREKWLFQKLKNLVTRVGYWEEFFTENGIIAYQHFSELSRDAMARQIAIDLVSGIEFGRQRSQYLWPAAAANHFLHEIAFCWQNSLEAVLKSGYGMPEILVKSGYPYDDIIRQEKKVAENIKIKLSEKNVKTVVAVFDNYPSGNNHLSWHHLLEFYGVIKEIIESRKDVGFIIKTKKPHIAAHRSLSSIFRYFIDHERCMVQSEILSSLMPAVLAADLVIGIPLSTALVEASLTGRPSIAFDPTNTPINPFKESGSNPIFFTSGEFKKYLLARLDDELGDKPNSSTGAVADTILCDRKGGARVAKFIAEFVNCRRAGINKHAAIDVAINSLGVDVYVSRTIGSASAE